METKKYDNVQIQRCTNCQGIWFKPGSASKLKEKFHSEFLDPGDPAIGKKYNELEGVKCPECSVELDKVTDERQIHIQYETCPNGHGAFFDAGEFTDWKYDTLMDRLRDLFARVSS